MEVDASIPQAFRNICRTCMKLSSELFPIFNSNEIKLSNRSFSISKMLILAGRISPKLDDKLPKYICRTCLKRLIEILKFQDMCIQSELSMQKMLFDNYSKNKPTNNETYTPITLSNNSNLSKPVDNLSLNESDETIIKLEIDEDDEEISKITKNSNNDTSNKSQSTQRNIDEEMVTAKTILNETTYSKYIQNLGGNKNSTAQSNKTVNVIMFQCNKCPEKFDLKLNYEKHLAEHKKIPETVYKCNQCPVQFSLKECYIKHIAEHKVIFHCSKCSIKFSLKENYEKHKQMHNDEISENKIDGKTSLNNSSKTKNNIPEIERNSPQINSVKSTDDKTSLNNSSKIKNNIPEIERNSPQINSVKSTKISTTVKSAVKFSCTFCKDPFETWADLGKHMTEHKIKNNYGTLTSDTPPPSSASSSASPPTVLTKKSIAEEKSPVYRCSLCSKKCTTRENLICHMGDHLKETHTKMDNFNKKHEVDKPKETSKGKTITPNNKIENKKSSGEKQKNLTSKGNESSSSDKLKKSNDSEFNSQLGEIFNEDINSSTSETKNRLNCYYCSSNYADITGLRKHLKKIHNSFIRIECYCGKIFKKYLDMIRHRKIHKCEPNTEEDKKIENTANEKKIENTDNANKCLECEKTFSNYHNMLRHFKFVHNNKINNKNSYSDVEPEKGVEQTLNDIATTCTQCQKNYHTPRNLKRHIETVHSNMFENDNDNIVNSNTPEDCPYCDVYSTSQLHLLNRHIKLSHPNKKVATMIQKKKVNIRKKVNTTAEPKKNKEAKETEEDILLKPCKCQYCSRRFYYMAELNRHILREHKKEFRMGIKTYDCPVCQKRFKKYLEMLRHKKGHKKNANKIKIDSPLDSLETFDFQIDSSSRSEENNLEIDINFEAVEEPQTLILENPNQTAEDPLNIQDLSMSKMPVMCEFCSSIFVNVYALNRHKKVFHQSNETENKEVVSEAEKVKSIFNCNKCTKTFESINGLRRHIQDIHAEKNLQANSVEVYECLICEKSFLRKTSLISHEKTHNSKEDVPIPNKNVSTSSGKVSETLNKSIPFNAEQPHKCLICFSIVKRRVNLRKHVKNSHPKKYRQHTLEKTEKHFYECQACFKSFERKSNYIVHFKKHLDIDSKGTKRKSTSGGPEVKEKKDGKVNLKCKICQKDDILNKIALSKHMWHHKNTAINNNLFCKICSRIFTTGKGYKVHLANKHADDAR